MEASGSSSLPPAGWYPDPYDATRERYWDGAAWSETVRAPVAEDPRSPQDQASGAKQPSEPKASGKKEPTKGEQAARPSWARRHPVILALITALAGVVVAGVVVGFVVASKKDSTINSQRKELATSQTKLTANQEATQALVTGTEWLGEVTLRIGRQLARTSSAKQRAQRQAAKAKRQLAKSRSGEAASGAAAEIAAELASAAVKQSQKGDSLVLTGKGSTEIGRLVVAQDSDLGWETTGSFLALVDSDLTIAVYAPATQGSAKLPAGIYSGVTLVTNGSWTVTITPRS